MSCAKFSFSAEAKQTICHEKSTPYRFIQLFKQKWRSFYIKELHFETNMHTRQFILHHAVQVAKQSPSVTPGGATNIVKKCINRMALIIRVIVKP